MRQRVLHHHRDLLDGQRLFEKVEGAQLGGLHRGLDGAVAGDHHHHGPLGERDFLDARQHLHAVHAGQPDIQQHQFEAAAGQRRQAGFAASDGFDGVAFVLEHAAQGTGGCRARHPLPGCAAASYVRRRPRRTAVAASARRPDAGISTVKRAPDGLVVFHADGARCARPRCG